MSRSGLPRSGSWISSRGRDVLPGRRRRWRPAAASCRSAGNGATAARPPRGRRSRPAARSSRTSRAEELMTTGAADEELVVEARHQPLRLRACLAGAADRSRLGTRGPYRPPASLGAGSGADGAGQPLRGLRHALVAFRRRGHSGSPVRSLTDDRQSHHSARSDRVRDRLRPARPRPAARAVGRGPRLAAVDARASWCERFEAAWEAWNALPGVAFSSWAGAAMAALEFAGVRGETVLCPSNTFMATPLSVLKAGGAAPVFVDCNREDLCVSFADFEAKAERAPPEGRLARPHRRPHRVRGRADRRLLPRARDLPDRGLRPRARRAMAGPAPPGPGATPASTRCTRPRRSRPARAASWSPEPR